MKLPPILRKAHDFITHKMSQSWFVNTVLIATLTEDNGEEYDCIYCTIIRNALLFSCIGFIVGYCVG